MKPKFEKTHLDCPVCLDRYDEGLRTPKMMPCLHTVCVSCILEICASPDLLAKPVISTSSITMQTSSLPLPGPPSTLNRDSTDSISSLKVSTKDQEGCTTTAQPRFVHDYPNVAITAFTSSPKTNRSHPALCRVSGNGPSKDLFQRNPCDPLPCTPPLPTPSHSKPLLPTPLPPKPTPPSPPTPPPALPARNMSSTPPGRPQKNIFTLKPKPCLKTSKEPEIPKNQRILCPLCRNQCITSRLQTNRYVLAHLRDLARLEMLRITNLSPAPVKQKPTDTSDTQPYMPVFSSNDFWCKTCDAFAQDCCSSHEVMPLKEWLETQRKTMVELQRTIQKQFNDYSSDLNDTNTNVNIILHSLNKVSRHLQSAHKEAQDVREELSTLTEPTSPSPSPRKQAQALSQRLASLRALENRVATMAAGTDSNEVYIYRQNNKLFISTCQPDRTIIITLYEGQHQEMK